MLLWASEGQLHKYLELNYKDRVVNCDHKVWENLKYHASYHGLNYAKTKLGTETCKRDDDKNTIMTCVIKWDQLPRYTDSLVHVQAITFQILPSNNYPQFLQNCKFILIFYWKLFTFLLFIYLFSTF